MPHQEKSRAGSSGLLLIHTFIYTRPSRNTEKVFIYHCFFLPILMQVLEKVELETRINVLRLMGSSNPDRAVRIRKMDGET